MSCDTGYPDTDPAVLQPTLLRRFPDVAGNADAFLRESATEFFRRSGIWRDHRLSLVCDPERTRYVLPDPLAGVVSRIVHVWHKVNDQDCKMRHDTEVRADNTEAQRWHEPTPGQVTFHKQFDHSCTLRFEVVLTIGPDNVGDVGLIREYREGIINGACYYAAMAQKKETSNPYSASDFYALFEGAIRDASSRVQQKAGVERAPMSRMHVINEV